MNRILIDNLCKNYGRNSIIVNLCAELDCKNIYFLTSENGSGKTTFFKCLLKETKYTGQIIDNNMKYAYLPDRALFPFLVILEEFIKMFLDLDFKYYYGPLIDDYLKLFDILKYKKMYLHQLSKGTKQKALIIKTILSNADVYLFDEPLAGLDQRSRSVFMLLVKQLQEQEKIVVIASHYFNEYQFDNKKELVFK